jgi:hypothetical protein
MKIKEIRKIERCKTPETSTCCTPNPNAPEKPPCCGPPATCTGGEIDEKVPGFLGWFTTAAGRVAHISTKLTFADHLGACRARWAINRMNYIVPAGLYAVGSPNPEDPVVVTCNYKMTFDIVRSALAGRTIWLLVLETHGVNVWCAAGKGTFGTGELVRRIKATGLDKVVSHRLLILPILGAPGVAAHEVARRTGFSVSYAAIRAIDLPEYLDTGKISTPVMRQLTFTLYERLVLIPVEIVLALKSVVIIGVAVLLLISVLGNLTAGIVGFCAYVGACLSGIVLGPLLLPWLPGRSFAVKGAVIGLLWSGMFYSCAGGYNWNGALITVLFLALPAVSAFYTLNFTGCTTYTSRSGVKKEMHLALPAMGGALIVSLILLLAGRFM